jgi:hypothetical protein
MKALEVGIKRAEPAIARPLQIPEGTEVIGRTPDELETTYFAPAGIFR